MQHIKSDEIHIKNLFLRCIIGISKIARVVDVCSKKLQTQERLCNEIAQAIYKYVEPAGVGVVIDEEHFCTEMRGIEKQRSSFSKSTMLGSFLENSRTRSEFLSLIK